MYCANDQCPDFASYGMRGEYREGISVCPRCGAALLPGAPPPKQAERAPGWPEGEPPAGPLVAVASFGSRHDADLALSFLAAHGIAVVKAGDDCGGVDPRLAFTTPTRLLVPRSQVEEAHRLLDEAVREG